MKQRKMFRSLALALALCAALSLIPASAANALSTAGGSAPGAGKEVVLANRKLNVSILQMPILDTVDSLEYLRSAVDGLMYGTLRPEVVVGVEGGLGYTPFRLDSEYIEYLSAIAKRYQIYFIPGTFLEISDDLEEGQYYNTCPVFGPDGSLIHAYRKKAPYYPVEENVVPGDSDDYCIFEIPEKGIKVGLLICYDQFFPEISRTLALEGAEMILCPAYDPAEFDFIPDVIPRCRALENELFFIWTNGVNGPCGNSTIVDPEGQVIYKCDSTEMTYTACLDFSKVTEKRLYGADQHLNTLRALGIRYPYAGKVDKAPLYQGWPELTMDKNAFNRRVSEIGVNTLPSSADTKTQAAQDARMDEIMKHLNG